jgi:hypothetical protein
MKNIITKFSVALTVLLLITACSDDFLSPDPKSFYTPEAVYVDEAGFESLLVTMRSDLRSEHLGLRGQRNYIAMGFTLSDLAISIEPSDLRNVTPSDGPTWPYLDFFDDAYEYIKNANVLVSRIDEVEWDNQQVRDRLLAEAYWHRAYWYYRLVNTYGNVPWIGEELQGAKVDFQTYTRDAILDKIQEDLTWAENRLDVGRSTNGDVSRGAASHLLAKVALAHRDYDTAVEAASRVINGPYALMTERFGIDADEAYRNVQWDLHRWQNKNIAQNTEAIYVAIDRPDAPPATRSGASYSNRNYTPSYWKILDENGNRWCNWSTPTGDTLGIGNADVRTNHYWHYKLWGDDTYTWETTPDERRADINWIEMNEIKGCHPESPNYGEHFTMDYYGSLVDTFDTWYPWPQYKTFVRSPNTRLPVGGEADWYIYRLAETYLIRAEARYWRGELGPAAQDINAVRDRANAPLITAANVTLDYIFDERARELYMEEPRHSEMVRASYLMAAEGREGYSLDGFSQSNWFYDRVMEVNDNYHQPAPIWRGSVSHIDPHNVLLPIPHSVIEANTQGRVNQNEGYDGAHNNIPPVTTIE